MFLITGATGNQGGAVVRELLKHGCRVRALTRDAQKPKALALKELGAEVIQGDLDDLVSIERALIDVEGVFAVQNFWETGAEREIQQGIQLADAAKAANIRHFVYSSVGSAHLKTGVPHFDSKAKIEEHIQQIEIPYTILRPVAFNYAWNDPNVRGYIQNGVFSLPLSPDTKLQLLSEQDYGVFVATALEKPDRWLGRSLDVMSEELTMLQMVEAFGNAIGRPVQYVQMSWEQSLQSYGEEYTAMFRFFEEVGYSANITVMQQEYGTLTNLEQYLRQQGW
ncbi:MAG: NmrA/HSCARG family protein [Cyanobacteria bacterium CRU_2_1]|nr:NmrA/HSCARG family protein [Cyanobacteria bacterium RU_5_0]NJR63551.1 NmrA/HSCARG family protein [Cyanobacteria bacterium CRU_2_1]